MNIAWGLPPRGAVVASTLFCVMIILCGPSLAVQSESQPAPSPAAIKKTIRQLRPLHEKLGKPLPGQWLDTHKEKGQIFSQYVRIRPNVLTPRRNKLYIQPIGTFSKSQQEIIKLSGEFLAIYHQCESVVLDSIEASTIPESARRIHPSWGVEQWLTSYILEDVLTPALPADAFASLAFTEADLWPGDGWNFVFGYASFRDRVGVWSTSRFGDPSESEAAFKLCLRRAIKLATHETGHMFSMAHCKKYRCNMQGSNHLEEADSQPLGMCPECHAKLLYATGAVPEKRFEQLIEFCKRNDLKEEEEYFTEALEAITQ